MSQQLGGQPILILKEGTTRNRDQEAQNSNIAAAKAVAAAVSSTLGPRGMDKMLIDGMGEITITNDGVTILKEMGHRAPCGKDDGRGCKRRRTRKWATAPQRPLSIGAELLKKAEGLLAQGVHTDRLSPKVTGWQRRSR